MPSAGSAQSHPHEDLHSQPLRIKCEAGVKQHRDALKTPLSLSRLGRQTAGETFCLTPNFFSNRSASLSWYTPATVLFLGIYAGRAGKVHNPESFRDVAWTSSLRLRKRS